MNSDLNGRKLVYADDICRYIKAKINPYGKPFEGSAYEFGLKIMEYIENMSVAYDADKVVQQMKSSSRTMSTSDPKHKYYKAIGTRKCEQIIRAGGKE